MPAPTIYTGNFIHSETYDKLLIRRSTAIGVDNSGKIAFIEPYTDILVDVPRLATQHDFTGYKHVACPAFTPSSSSSSGSSRKVTSFFVPGFIDTHTHAPQYPNTGIFGSSTLLDWLNTYTFPMESSFKNLALGRRVYNRVVSRSLSHGTTCAAYYATIHVPATNLLADICLAKGQRALVGRVCMDRLSPEHYRDESVASAVRDTESCIAHIESIDPSAEIVRPVITPRFAPSCTDECMLKLGELHRRTNHFVQTHISENKAEIALVAKLFPSAKDYATVYDQAGLLSERTILAHAVHLGHDEVQLIATRGSKISHCPTSNSCLTSGAARVKDLKDAGVDVGLGTDMSGGYSPSILEMVRQALLVSRHAAMADGDKAKLAVEEALWHATRGGAKVVGLEGKVGAFEVGMEWDAQLISLTHVDEDDRVGEGAGGPHTDSTHEFTETGPVDMFGWESWDDTVAKWVYTGDDRNVAAVWVKGRCVHDRNGVYSQASK